MQVIPFYYDDYDDLFANTYIVIDSDNNCVIIDPSKDYDGLVNYIHKNNLNPKGILLTHGHFDHIRGVERLINEFNIPFYIGFEEEEFLTNPTLNCSRLMAKNGYVLDMKPITLSDGEKINLLNEEIVVISTPYHTIGSLCYYLKDSNLLFSGDFIFKGSVGRSDLPSGTPRTFNSSLSKILALPNDTKIYPGHGPSSTLELEKRGNPFFPHLNK